MKLGTGSGIFEMKEREAALKIENRLSSAPHILQRKTLVYQFL